MQSFKQDESSAPITNMYFTTAIGATNRLMMKPATIRQADARPKFVMNASKGPDFKRSLSQTEASFSQKKL